MDGKLPRYRVSRTLNDGWAVIDTSKAKIRMHNDIIETLPTRNAARLRAHQLNLQEFQEKNPHPTTGDAA